MILSRGEIMKFLISLFVAALGANAFAALDSAADVSKDGRAVSCKTAGDSGVWAYRLNAEPSVRESAARLEFSFDVSYLVCGNQNDGTVDWQARRPYDPIVRNVNGRPVISVIKQANAVLVDAEDYSRVTVAADNMDRQKFNFTVDATEIQKIVAKLKPGQVYSKDYYFLTEHQTTTPQGGLVWSSGGAYTVTLKWTRDAHTVAFKKTFAAPFPHPAVVSCDVLYQIQNIRQPDVNYEMQISDIESCDSRIGDFNVPNTPIKLSFLFMAACQQPDNSFPEHISVVNLAGPKGSSVYASTFSLGEHPSQRSLQLTASLDGTKYNVIAHCKIVR
jgi:hypothetical protein